MEKKNLGSSTTKIRTITNGVASALLFAAGLIFMIVIDLKVKKFEPFTYIQNGEEKTYKLILSLYLLVAAILALGSAIFYLFGDSRKNKHVQTLLFKGIGMALAVGFIIFLFVFKNALHTYRYPAQHFPESNFAASKYFISSEIYSIGNAVVIICLVIAIIGIITYIVNYILSIKFIDEDY